MESRYTKIKHRKPGNHKKPERPKKPVNDKSAAKSDTKSFETENKGALPLEEIPAGKKLRKRRRKWLRVLLRLALVTVSVVAVLYVGNNWDAFAPDSMVYWINSMITGQTKGDGFPVDITGSAVISMNRTKEGLAVLTDTSYILYNGNGGILAQRQHGFSRPFMKTAGKWTIIADLEGKGLRIESRSGTLVKMELSDTILGAAVNEKADFAVITTSSGGYTSVATAYSKDKEKLYQWNSSVQQLTDIAIGADGKTLVMSAFTAENGAMKSSVMRFNIASETPEVIVEDVDQLLFRVGFFSNGNITAIGDTGIWVADKSSGSAKKTGYDDHIPMGFSIGDASAEVVLQHYGNTTGGQVISVNSQGNKQYTESFDGDFRSIAPCPGGSFLLTSQNLYRTDAKGIKDKSEVMRDGLFVGALGNRAVVSGLTQMQEY